MTDLTAFIFDMDGTVIDSMPFHYRSWLKAFSEFGIEITEEHLHRNNKGTLSEVTRRIAGDRFTADEVAAFGERKEVLFRELFLPHLKPIDGTIEFLAGTRQLGIKTALATNAGWENTDYVLDGLKLRSYFDVVVSGDEVAQGKPDPEILLLASKRAVVPPQRCLVFEDSISGITAVRRAGMRAVIIRTELSEKELNRNPVVVGSSDDYINMDPQQLQLELLP